VARLSRFHGFCLGRFFLWNAFFLSFPRRRESIFGLELPPGSVGGQCAQQFVDDGQGVAAGDFVHETGEVDVGCVVGAV